MEDQQLVEQVLAGRTLAFEGLVRRHQGPLFHYLGRLGLPPAAVEDLAQEALLRAYRHLARFDPERGRFSTWLFTIARRLALNELERRRRWIAAAGDPEPAVEDPPGEMTSARDRVREALARLPLEYRSPIALAYLRGLGMEEIARIEGCSVGTVKSRIHRGKQRLRDQLADLLGDDDHAP
jgi:RNA polymerase sigma-70 factor (ECF subfamily)